MEEKMVDKLAALNKLPAELEAEKAQASQNVLFNYDDLVNGHIRQEVEISPRVQVVFQTLNGAEDQWLKDLPSDMTGKPIDYVSTWYRNRELALGVVSLALSGKQMDLPEVLYDTPKGAFFPVPVPASVEKRQAVMLNCLPSTVLVRVQLQYSWFLERATKDVVGGSLKNG